MIPCKSMCKQLKLAVIANKVWHKIVWNDFEQALLGPLGEGHDCMEAGSRATQDAVAEEARSNLLVGGTTLRLPRQY